MKVKHKRRQKLWEGDSRRVGGERWEVRGDKEGLYSHTTSLQRRREWLSRHRLWSERNEIQRERGGGKKIMKEPEKESFNRLTRSLKSEMTRMSEGSGRARFTPPKSGKWRGGWFKVREKGRAADLKKKKKKVSGDFLIWFTLTVRCNVRQVFNLLVLWSELIK